MKVTTKKMSVADFQKIPDNPIQRDTARHARNSSRPGGHLSKLSPTHHRVAIAVLKGGKKQWVLDGHSRRFLWEEGELETPKTLTCDVYEVEDEGEARDLYLTFDSSSATESAQDKFFGAMRYHNFQPHNILLQNAGTIEAMKRLAFPRRYSDLKNLPTHMLIKPWMPSIRIVDSAHHSIKNHIFFPSWITTAMLMTLRRDKRVSLSFWEAYANKEGVKGKNDMDGIYAVNALFDYVKENDKGRGNTLVAKYTPAVLYAYECWKEGEKLPTKVRGIIGNKDKWPSLSEWWKEHIGKYDHPQLRNQEDDIEQST